MNLFQNGLDWSFVTDALFMVIPILICLTIHELAHGAAALALGDDTAKRMGRLTLNPIKHIDPMGFIMLLVVRFGWAKPVPVDMDKFKNPKLGMALTALAGPMSNFLLAGLIFLFQVPLGFMMRDGGLALFVGASLHERLLASTALISVFLGVFNLLPIPPLDGSKIVFGLLRDSHYNLLMRYERLGFVLLIALIWWGGLTTGPLRDVMNGVVRFIFELMRGPSVFLFG
ncbi:MAG: site-2 protease family protein [Oscillospiraceae bacterium]|nr:site-2 protease family protein [Oscillospiraceae bacterium]